MAEFPFVWLGSGRAKKRGIGEKGRWLDAAAKAGLPVPAGGIVQDEFLQICLDAEVVVGDGGLFYVPDPDWLWAVLYEDVRFPLLDGLVAVRGAGKAVLNVNPADPQQLGQAFVKVWNGNVTEGRRDVLLMTMVAGKVAGTAVNHPHQPATMTTPDGTVHLPPLRFWQKPDANLPPHAQRLQKLLRGLRRTFGDIDWQIEWLDDGEVCWLMQMQMLD